MDLEIKKILEMALPEMVEAIRLYEAGDADGLRELLRGKCEALGRVLQLLDRRSSPDGTNAPLARRSLAW